MKFLAFILLFAMSMTAYGQGTYDATGAVKLQAKEYAAFVNSAAATLTVGEAICLDLTADDGIAVDYCTANGLPLGVIVSDCAVGARCKVQTKGVFDLAVLDVTQGAATAGKAAFVHTDGSLYGTATTTDKFPVGVFLDSAAASGTVQIFIKP